MVNKDSWVVYNNIIERRIQMRNLNINKLLAIFIALTLILSTASFFPSEIVSADKNDVSISNQEDKVSEEKKNPATNPNQEDNPEEEKQELIEKEAFNGKEAVNNEENKETKQEKVESKEDSQEVLEQNEKAPSQDKERESIKDDPKVPQKEKQLMETKRSSKKEPRDPKRGSIKINKVDGDTGEPNVVRVPQTRVLPPTSFRFHLTVDTLVLS